MSKEEIKQEINKVLEHLSDKTLQDILSFLKGVKGEKSFSLSDRAQLEQILQEDRELLQKLAK